ncbi:MAG: aminomethyl-transferring glycine dehydrogenase subunit GcvPA [Acidobacteria bacterium]|nr:aminomethyl-transferring glycine dehydrogenase subunit GcvPA [Acidobacteriota bacterium]MBU4307948.1 aminomethyl-transferring glycine dehydrogenase subunit GcvPA [Acidobacteriota bacterium]MCG2811802.1 aminomethyl-transferring glycine dehydrogenase subunit GcvPA [Candidatus Aminicenantes bacterium]
MRYLPLTETEREEMRKTIGIKETKELFSDIPKDKSYFSLADLPAALSEPELLDKFNEIGRKNIFPGFLSFLGAGAYQHFIPELVNFLSNKSEFLTPYTPYQPEVSQGSLQGMFEYQTMMAQLTDMDIANSSLYDGGTAAAEGIVLALKKSKKQHILIAGNIHPEYIEIMQTYIKYLDYKMDLVPFDPQSGKLKLAELQGKIDQDTAGFIFQSPNFFGVVEEGKQISAMLHSKNSYSLQIVTEALSLAFLVPPGENDVDLVVGEAQSFGLPLGFGGPYLGFIAAKSEFLRQMPGRFVGQTLDSKGNRGYVLTLSTREQHIKRERATSNICTNEAWCAFRAGIYLATMGKKGLRSIAKTNHLNTAYFVKEVSKLNNVKVKYQKDYYNEVVLEVQNGKTDDFLKKLEAKKILAGIPLHWFYPDQKNTILVNFTEIHRKKDIDQLVQAIGEIK